MKSDSELKFPREQGYFERSLWVKVLIGALLTAALFFFLHFREEHVEVYELDSLAPKFVVAQTDFYFKDQEKKWILQQDAVHNVGKIWRLSERELREKRADVDGDLSTGAQWEKLFPLLSLTKVNKGVDQFQKGVLKLKFTDQTTLALLEENGFNPDEFQIFDPGPELEGVHIPEYVWNGVEEVVSEQSPFPEQMGMYLTHFYAQVPWELEEDIEAEQRLRTRIYKGIEDQYSFVAAGDRVINQGDRVTDRHLVMLQAMKRALSEGRNSFHPLTLLGSLILAVMITFVSASYLYYNHPQVLHSNRKLFLLATIVIFTLVVSKGMELWLLNSRVSLAEMVRYPLFVPLAAILVCHLINSGVATFVAGFLTIVMMLGGTLDITGMVMNLAASLIAILETRTLRRRKEIFIVCAKAWLATIWVIIAFHLYDGTIFDISMVNDLVSSFAFMLLTSVLVIGFLPLFETSFQIMTDVTLMEYMDPSHELLRRLSIEAPGTYQHSVVVGSLAETAALAIGANGLFCRVSTLYHDIGKMTTPQYFTENQQGDVNIHQLLTPQESSQVIIAHVSEGVSMARRAGLPEQFIDIIREHHGTSLVYYFYRQYLDQMGGDKSLVDEKEFRYSGPRPKSKESAIIMIADTFEAASRSLDEVNEHTLNELIDKLIQIKTQDGQLDDCVLTFHELASVKKVMVQTLIAAGHSRVKYPKMDEDEQPLDRVQNI